MALSKSSFAKAHKSPVKPFPNATSWLQADAKVETYGMVEEFLELSRRLSVQTIRNFVAAVHKRIPKLFLEPFGENYCMNVTAGQPQIRLCGL